MTILVTGGSGYIGSHVVRMLVARGERPLVVDRADEAPIAEDRYASFSLDLCAHDAVAPLRRILIGHEVKTVIHLAALKQVQESVQRPMLYYSENIGGLSNLLTAMEGSPVEKFVFSSSASVYGNPLRLPVAEGDRKAPMSPYGETKLAGEWLARSAAQALGIRALSLRYFNVAGAGWPDLGDRGCLNLLTIAIEAIGRGDAPVIFGDDFPTSDGSAVRDYVHVLDLAEAHIEALAYLDDDDRAADVINVGTGIGVSVKELLSELIRVSETSLRPLVGPRRPGDPAEVVADVTEMAAGLGSVARRTVAEMVASAWQAYQWRKVREEAVVH